MELLVGAVQPYAWGDPEFIPRLQARTPTGGPEAELWFGAHPVAPSALGRSGGSLADAISADPGFWLGPETERRFGRFPFLLKVLAAAEPLSIQAHPSRAQAAEGFAREQRSGLPWDAPDRMYRDDNHKPEILVALTRFEARCGFRPLDDTRRLIRLLVAAGADELGAELARRLDGPLAGGDAGDDADVLAAVLRWLLGDIGGDGPALVAEIVAASGKLLAGGGAGPGEAFGPELRWTPRLDAFHPGDIGVVVALLLNHVVLEPGQGVFLEAGNLHAYLSGAGVELMANGDNVIRGGLTPKHVDGVELAAIVDTRPGAAPVQTAAGSQHRFASPVPEFSLTRILGPDRGDMEPRGPEIVLVTAGTAELVGATGPALVVGPGQAAVVAAGDGPYRLAAGAGAVVWRATVGDPVGS